MLKIDKLTKRFSAKGRTTVAVDSIDLEIADGEYFVLLGPSGCGKTTLLNLIAGLEKPSSGSIAFNGKTLCAPQQGIFLSPRERAVAMVFQDYALYPHLTVYENIAFPLRIAKRKQRDFDRDVREVASGLDLDHVLFAKPGELSGGQRQRVAIGRAIIRRPNIFLLDEPLSNLDAQLRTTTRTELKKLQKKIGVTTVYVTHDQIEAMTLGDRIAVIRSGKIEQVGTPFDLYDRPANPFVASFIGTPPMNVVNVAVGTDDKDGITVNFDGALFTVAPGPNVKETASGKSSRTLGIRPEYIRIAGDSDKARIPVEVSAVEMAGRERMVYTATSDGQRLIMLSHSVSIQAGERIVLSFDPERAHVW
ncbi:MAG: ABC transporter ATP-binding protein [Kiritimatiellia bacterium]|nr:ABC transporter ATP-binding protein [Kiritimatiellia bacterium]